MPNCYYCVPHEARGEFGDFSNCSVGPSSSYSASVDWFHPPGCGLQLPTIADPSFSYGSSAAHIPGDACRLRHQQQPVPGSCGDPPASTTGPPLGPAAGLHNGLAAASQPPSLPGYWQQQQEEAAPHVDAGYSAMNALYNQLLYNQLFADQFRLLGLQQNNNNNNNVCQLDFNYSINGLIQQQASVSEAVSGTTPASIDPPRSDTTDGTMPGGSASCQGDSAGQRRQSVGRTAEAAGDVDDIDDDASTDGEQHQQQRQSASNSSTSSSEEMRSMKVHMEAALRAEAPPSPTVQPDCDVDECDADADVLGSSPTSSLSYADRLRMMVAHRGIQQQQQRRRGSLDPSLLLAAGRKTSAPGFAASLIGQSGHARRGSNPLVINSEGSTYRGLGAALGVRGAPLDFENLKLELEKLMTGPASDLEKKTGVAAGGGTGGMGANETAKASSGSAVSPPTALTAQSSTSSPTNLQPTASTATSILQCTIPSGTHVVPIPDKTLTTSTVSNPVTSNTLHAGVTTLNQHLQPMAPPQNLLAPPPPPPGSPYGFELTDMSDVVAYVIKTSPFARLLVDFVTQQALQYDKGFHAMQQRHRQEQSDLIGRQQMELNSLRSLFATNPLTMAAVVRAAQGQGHPTMTSCSSSAPGMLLPWWTDPSSAELWSQYQRFLPTSQQQLATSCSAVWSQQQNQGAHHMTCPPGCCATDDSAADDDQLQELQRSKTLDAGEMRRLRRFSLGNLCEMPPRLRQMLMGSSVQLAATAETTTNSTGDHFDQFHRRQSESAVTVPHGHAGGNLANRPVATVHASANPALSALFSSGQVPSVPLSSSTTAPQPLVQGRVMLPADGRTGFGSTVEASTSFPVRTTTSPGFPNNISITAAVSTPSTECREVFATDGVQALSSLLHLPQYMYGTLQQQQQQQQLMQMQQQAQLIMQQRQLQQFAQQQQQLQQQQQFLTQTGAYGYFPQWTHHG